MEFHSTLEKDLQKQMETIFKIKTREKITLISKKKQEIYEYGGDTYWIEVPIVNRQDEILCTVEDVLENICSDQETKRGVYKKIITTTTIDDNIPDVLLLKYDRFNSSGKKNANKMSSVERA